MNLINNILGQFMVPVINLNQVIQVERTAPCKELHPVALVNNIFVSLYRLKIVNELPFEVTIEINQLSDFDFPSIRRNIYNGQRIQLRAKQRINSHQFGKNLMANGAPFRYILIEDNQNKVDLEVDYCKDMLTMFSASGRYQISHECDGFGHCTLVIDFSSEQKERQRREKRRRRHEQEEEAQRQRDQEEEQRRVRETERTAERQRQIQELRRRESEEQEQFRLAHERQRRLQEEYQRLEQRRLSENFLNDARHYLNAADVILAGNQNLRERYRSAESEMLQALANVKNSLQILPSAEAEQLLVEILRQSNITGNNRMIREIRELQTEYFSNEDVNRTHELGHSILSQETELIRQVRF